MLSSSFVFLSFLTSWNAIAVDGHDIPAVIAAFDAAKACKGKPTALLAKTYKGYAWDGAADGISDLMGWHGKPLGDRAAGVLEKIKASTKNLEAFIPPPQPEKKLSAPDLSEIKLSSPPTYEAGAKVR